MDVGGEELLRQLKAQHDAEECAGADLNISDIIEAISIADPAAAAAADMARSPAQAPYVRIVEQPASKALRFRYECEGRSAGSIPGVNSNGDRRTYPTIEVCGYAGKAIVVVSCVTRDEPYKPHPHNLVGREHCRSGVCTMKVDLRESPQLTFSNLGIQCVKRRDIVNALTKREELRVDPFRTGYEHMNQPQSIDLNAVRLCFQVFLDDESGRFRHALKAVVSDVIYDKKAMSDLQIVRISQPSGPMRGGTEVILLCEKVNREDIAVVVCEEGQEQRETAANVIVVHKQVAIAFTMPPYREPGADKHVDVYIQLKRPSDNARSNSVPYQYIPSYQADHLGIKRRKAAIPLSIMEQIERESALWNQEQKIKTEPAGTSPVRFTPLEPAGDNSYQVNEAFTVQVPRVQWPQDVAIAGPSNASYLVPDVPWQGQPFAAPAPAPVQAMQAPNLSPNMQPRSPHLQPSMQVTSMQGQVMSPQRQVISPHGRVMSPHTQVMSPQGRVMSPQQQVMSPQGQMMSPQHQVMSPQGHMMSPQHQVMTTQGEMMSPQHQIMSPQGQMMSPQHQVMSPQGQMMSPQRQVISPHMGQMEASDSGATQMGHVSSLQNVSLLMDAMAQAQAQSQSQAPQQAMDTISGSVSLTSLLAEGVPPGEPMQQVQLNSGELSELLGLGLGAGLGAGLGLGGVPRGADLSDSLNKLSTSDLLH